MAKKVNDKKVHSILVKVSKNQYNFITKFAENEMKKLEYKDVFVLEISNSDAVCIIISEYIKYVEKLDFRG
jgi:hypothetical protein